MSIALSMPHQSMARVNQGVGRVVANKTIQSLPLRGGWTDSQSKSGHLKWQLEGSANLALLSNILHTNWYKETPANEQPGWCLWTYLHPIWHVEQVAKIKKNSLKPLFAFGGVEGEVTFKATQRNQEAEVSIRLDHAQLHFYLSWISQPGWFGLGWK